ncbi:MAG: 25S rRNA (adenine645-N1)-methyltransferase [Phylliscum demangeonii]|nr:MAG: 25S rRNA (adenine645-N1)-methyltransferase [Phylliscum demangeonii]
MFAVSGWSLSSTSLKRQTKAIAEEDEAGKDHESSAAPSSIPKKRKRARRQASAVTKENVAELWATVIEGKGRGAVAASQPHQHGITRARRREEEEEEVEEGRVVKTKKKKMKRAIMGTDAVIASSDDADGRTARAGRKEQEKEEEAEVSTKTNKKRATTVTDMMKASRDDADADEGGREGGGGGGGGGGGTRSPGQKVKKPRKRRKAVDQGAVEKTAKTASMEPGHDSAPRPSAASVGMPMGVGPSKLTPLQASMRQKLTSARFRHLNERLYTTASSDSLQRFAENPAMFEEYHQGFRRQVSVWPENPVDGYIEEVKERGTRASGTSVPPLPRTHGICTLADLGCGDAQLAQALAPLAAALKLQLHSFDLHRAHPLVTRADMAQLPLADASVDLAICCLALMGTNWPDFIEEAYRILRWKGELWIAEIKSRFGRVRPTAAPATTKTKTKPHPKTSDPGPLADEITLDAHPAASSTPLAPPPPPTDLAAFVAVLRSRGFALAADEAAVDTRNKMFVRMRFVKRLPPSKGKGKPKAKALLEAKGAGLGRAQDRYGRPKTKFLDPVVGGGGGAHADQDAEADADEAAVLKPCAYKTR